MHTQVARLDLGVWRAILLVRRYAEPVRVATDRARQHLGSEWLKVHGSLSIEAVVHGDDCHVTVEGVPGPLLSADGAEVEDEVHEADDTADDDGAPVCATFVNEINLLDLFDDVHEIYKSFTTNLALQTVTPTASATQHAQKAAKERSSKERTSN